MHNVAPPYNLELLLAVTSELSPRLPVQALSLVLKTFCRFTLPGGTPLYAPYGCEHSSSVDGLRSHAGSRSG